MHHRRWRHRAIGAIALPAITHLIGISAALVLSAIFGAHEAISVHERDRCCNRRSLFVGCIFCYEPNGASASSAILFGRGIVAAGIRRYGGSLAARRAQSAAATAISTILSLLRRRRGGSRIRPIVDVIVALRIMGRSSHDKQLRRAISTVENSGLTKSPLLKMTSDNTPR